jgi:hypothetical protein
MSRVSAVFVDSICRVPRHLAGIFAVQYFLIMLIAARILLLAPCRRRMGVRLWPPGPQKTGRQA